MCILCVAAILPGPSLLPIVHTGYLLRPAGTWGMRVTTTWLRRRYNLKVSKNKTALEEFQCVLAVYGAADGYPRAEAMALTMVENGVWSVANPSNWFFQEFCREWWVLKASALLTMVRGVVCCLAGLVTIAGRSNHKVCLVSMHQQAKYTK